MLLKYLVELKGLKSCLMSFSMIRERIPYKIIRLNFLNVFFLEKLKEYLGIYNL